MVGRVGVLFAAMPYSKERRKIKRFPLQRPVICHGGGMPVHPILRQDQGMVDVSSTTIEQCAQALDRIVISRHSWAGIRDAEDGEFPRSETDGGDNGYLGTGIKHRIAIPRGENICWPERLQGPGHKD